MGKEATAKNVVNNTESEAQNSAEHLADEIMDLAISKLMVNVRFMDSAMSRLKRIRYQGPLAVDGIHFFYNPVEILLNYKQSKDAPAHAYLHGVLHCIFQHFYVGKLVERDCWNLACDIAVEAVILELELNCTKIGIEDQQKQAIDRIKQDAGMMTAERLYRFILDGGVSKEQISELRPLFEIDDHRVWFGMGKSDEEDDFGQDSPSSGNAGENDDYEERPKDQLEDEFAPRNNNADKQNARSEWEDVAEKMQMDLESFSKDKGNKAGTMIQNLRAVSREKFDYAAFLKRFAVLGETMHVNHDEFDYIFYTYGLDMYGKMPLIEPLEYKEVKKIKDFVIAIDTSGSVNGSLVQRFIQKTYNILEQQENFFTKINLRIIQCDQEIQEDVKIENKEQFDAYLDNMQIKGMGGTDFRPVFSYVDDLIAARELTNLKGLIYFTDGEGTFPDRQPQYDAAFVFVDDEYNVPDVPVWAIRIVLQRNEI